MSKKWTHGVMKEKLSFFNVGDEVLMVESTIEHAHPNMGASHWLMSRDGTHILLVNDYEFGPNLNRLVRKTTLVEAEKQEKCTVKAKELMKDSAYSPKNRTKQTYFFGGKPHGDGF